VGWAVGPTQKHLPSYWVKPIIRLIIWLAAEHELIHVLHAFSRRRKEANEGREEERGLPSREGILLG
jgi:hypothetical protein